MTARNLVLYPSPQLREISQEVSDLRSAKSLLQDLKDTLVAEEGLGLAAPQIGVLARVFVFWRNDGSGGKFIQTVINPKVTFLGTKIDSEEGCLSIPGYRDVVKRNSRILVSFFNEQGEDIKLELEGLEARCFQHELDHLNGVLFIDHFSIEQKRLFNSWVKKQDWFKS